MDVTPFISGFDAVTVIARYVLLGITGLVGIVCAVDWLIRTRRLSPFGPAARFFRKTVDPAIAPVERAVVRSGGVPSSAPIWTLLAVVIAGIIVLSLLGFVRDEILVTITAARVGPRAILALVAGWAFGLFELALIVRVAASWLRIGQYSRWVRWSYTLTEWIVRPLRQRLPAVGMFDISPMVALAIVWGLSQLAHVVIGG